MAAVNLHAVVSRFVTDFGNERLGDRRDERHQLIGFLALFFGLGQLDGVTHHCRPVHHRTTTFSERLGGQQHAAYVRVNNDRVGRAVRIFRAGQGAHGETLFGITQATLETGFGMGNTLNRSTQTGKVHKGEHAVQPTVLRADQVTGGAIKIHHAGSRCLDAHLVLNRAALDRVTCAQRAIRIDHHFRHDKQGNTLGAFRCTRQTGQYDMDDVVGHVVLAGGDKDLGAVQLVAAIGLRLSLGFQGAKVRTTMRLGQAHGAGPLAADQLRQVGVLLLRGAVLFNGGNSTVGQARVHAPGPVGGTGHFGNGDASRARQALTTKLRMTTHGRPAAFNVLGIGFLEALRRGDDAIIPLAAFLIAGAVQRSQLILGKLGAFLEECVDQLAVHFIQTQLLIVTIQVQHFVQNKTHVAYGSFILSHDPPPEMGRRH